MYVWNKTLIIFLLPLVVSFQKSEQQQNQGDPRRHIWWSFRSAGTDSDRESTGISAWTNV